MCTLRTYKKMYISILLFRHFVFIMHLQQKIIPFGLRARRSCFSNNLRRSGLSCWELHRSEMYHAVSSFQRRLRIQYRSQPRRHSSNLLQYNRSPSQRQHGLLYGIFRWMTTHVLSSSARSPELTSRDNRTKQCNMDK